MRFSTAITILSAALAPATASVVSSKRATGDDLKVPGDSPLTFCDSDHSKDVLTIESVDLSPNPPLA